jgi:hypothetical protein
VRYVALEIPLSTLGLGRDIECDDPRRPGIQVLHEALDGAAFAGGVPALEDNHKAAPGILHPILQLEQPSVGVTEHRVILVGIIHPDARRHHTPAVRTTRAQVTRAAFPPVTHISPIHAALLPEGSGRLRRSAALADRFHQEFIAMATQCSGMPTVGSASGAQPPKPR